MSGLVTFDLCKGNPGALQFMMLAYKGKMFLAERGFARMRDNDIVGDKLYMLWNDCCNRNTEQAVKIMCENPIEDIIEHINYERGRGIPYKAGDTDGKQLNTSKSIVAVIASIMIGKSIDAETEQRIREQDENTFIVIAL